MGGQGQRPGRPRGRARQRAVGPARGAGGPPHLHLRRQPGLHEAASLLLSTFDTGRGADPIQQSGLADGFHSGQLSPDGTFFYGTTTGFMGFFAPLGPCLTVVDLLDPVHPEGRHALGARSSPATTSASTRPASRAFVGTYAPLIGHPAAVVGRVRPAAASRRSCSTGMQVLDVSEIAARKPGGRLVRVGRLGGADQHTETYAKIGGKEYVIGAEEATCPGGNGRIVDISDPSRPRQVSKITLGVNRPAGCAHTFARGRARSRTCSSTCRTTCRSTIRRTPRLAFFSWYASGLRVFDIRDPEHPVEVAYFNPPVGPTGARVHDSTTTYPRYVPETGQIWVGSSRQRLLGGGARPVAAARGACAARDPCRVVDCRASRSGPDAATRPPRCRPTPRIGLVPAAPQGSGGGSRRADRACAHLASSSERLAPASWWLSMVAPGRERGRRWTRAGRAPPGCRALASPSTTPRWTRPTGSCRS